LWTSPRAEKALDIIKLVDDVYGDKALKKTQIYEI
jgi:hypothetical protein